MDLSELNSLTPDTIGSWPVPVRGFLLLLIFAGVLGGAWYLDWQKGMDEYDSLKKKEGSYENRIKEPNTLWNQFYVKQKKLVNLEEYQENLDEMRETLKDMVGRLPDDEEVAAFIRDISLVAMQSGLEISLLQPGEKRELSGKDIKGVYEMPVNITVEGNYHKFGGFVSRVSKLSRIITMSDFQIRSNSRSKKDRSFTMKAVAKIYKYKDGSKDNDDKGGAKK